MTLRVKRRGRKPSQSQRPTLHLPGGSLDTAAQSMLQFFEKAQERQERMMAVLLEQSRRRPSKFTLVGNIDF